MPEHFLKQLEVSQIQYIGSIIMSIGRNNWDVLLNKLENDTINTKQSPRNKGSHTSVTTLSQYVSASMRARKLNRMAPKKATKTVQCLLNSEGKLNLLTRSNIESGTQEIGGRQDGQLPTQVLADNLTQRGRLCPLHHYLPTQVQVASYVTMPLRSFDFFLLSLPQTWEFSCMHSIYQKVCGLDKLHGLVRRL